jgi:hypothetical protein
MQRNAKLNGDLHHLPHGPMRLGLHQRLIVGPPEADPRRVVANRANLARGASTSGCPRQRPCLARTSVSVISSRTGIVRAQAIKKTSTKQTSSTTAELGWNNPVIMNMPASTAKGITLAGRQIAGLITVVSLISDASPADQQFGHLAMSEPPHTMPCVRLRPALATLLDSAQASALIPSEAKASPATVPSLFSAPPIRALYATQPPSSMSPDCPTVGRSSSNGSVRTPRHRRLKSDVPY